MKIWELCADVDGFDGFTLVENSKKLELIDMFNGTKLAKIWTPMIVKYINGRNIKGKPKRKGDLSHFLAGAYIVNSIFVDELKGYVEDHAEFLPLIYKNKEYYLMNVTTIINCINHDKSEFEYSPSTGEVMWCKRYSFIEECLEGIHLFRTAEFPRASIFISDELKRRISESRLEGIRFIEVYDSNE